MSSVRPTRAAKDGTAASCEGEDVAGRHVADQRHRIGGGVPCQPDPATHHSRLAIWHRLQLPQESDAPALRAHRGHARQLSIATAAPHPQPRQPIGPTGAEWDDERELTLFNHLVGHRVPLELVAEEDAAAIVKPLEHIGTPLLRELDRRGDLKGGLEDHHAIHDAAPDEQSRLRPGDRGPHEALPVVEGLLVVIVTDPVDAVAVAHEVDARGRLESQRPDVETPYAD